jgi:glycosyltransferase involved in cell wall biosynthesis
MSEPDEGIYDAMNKAVHLVMGDWIIFMNAGDLFYDNNVSKFFIGFIKNDVDIYYGDTCLDGKRIIYGPKKLYPFFFYMERMITHQAIFARTMLFDIKKFDTRFPVVADRDWLMFFHHNKYKIRHIPLTVCIYSSLGVSSNMENHRRDSFKLIKETYGNLGLVFAIFKRFFGNIIRSLIYYFKHPKTLS